MYAKLTSVLRLGQIIEIWILKFFSFCAKLAALSIIVRQLFFEKIICFVEPGTRSIQNRRAFARGYGGLLATLRRVLIDVFEAFRILHAGVVRHF